MLGIPVWNPSYTVGNKLLDEQHIYILDLCQKISLSIEDIEFDLVNFYELTTSFSSYVEFHFETEEKILEKHHYPLLDIHKKEHLAYLSALTNAIDGAISGTSTKSVLRHYLVQWWVEHILCADKQYVSAITLEDYSI